MEGILLKYTLLWAIAVVMSNGSGILQAKEKRLFDTQAACEEYAKEFSPRMADWTRGVLKLDWDAQVRVAYRCADNAQKS